MSGQDKGRGGHLYTFVQTHTVQYIILFGTAVLPNTAALRCAFLQADDDDEAHAWREPIVCTV